MAKMNRIVYKEGRKITYDYNSRVVELEVEIILDAGDDPATEYAALMKNVEAQVEYAAKKILREMMGRPKK